VSVHDCWKAWITCLAGWSPVCGWTGCLAGECAQYRSAGKRVDKVSRLQKAGIQESGSWVDRVSSRSVYRTGKRVDRMSSRLVDKSPVDWWTQGV